MTSVEDHTARVLALAEPLAPVVKPLSECLGLISYDNVVAKLSVPAFDNSAMDGFAVRVADLAGASATSPVTLPVSGDTPAGATPLPLSAGTVQRVMTGAPVPMGTEAVVAVEDTDQPAGPAALPTEVAFFVEPAIGKHIRLAGESCKTGEMVFSSGTILCSASLAAAASVGYGTLRVYPRPRVAVLSTGSELVAAGQPLLPGKIPDSNSIMLAGLVREYDAECVWAATCPDDPATVERALVEASLNADLVITSGGVSAGAFDVIRQLRNVRELNFDKVAQQPGKPQGWGYISASDGRRIPLLAFPGNPVGTFVSFHLYARPLLSHLAGDGAEVILEIVSTIRAATGWRSPSGRRQYTPVAVVGHDGDGMALVTPVHRLDSASHLSTSLHRAQYLAITAEHKSETLPGDLMQAIKIHRNRGYDE